MVTKMVSDVYDVSIGGETTEILRNVLDAPHAVLDYRIELNKKFGIIK
jgi:hypothetical protein